MFTRRGRREVSHFVRLFSSSVGIVGATGAVGLELVEVLAKRNFPLSKLRFFASKRSAGKVMQTKFGPITVELFSPELARETDFLFLAASGTFAKEHANALTAPGGPVVIDNSSAFRLDPKVPLVVPEVNASAVGSAKLIANPNCTTAIAVMALAPLHQAFGLKKIIVSTYQAASGAGIAGIDELKNGVRDFLDDKPAKNEVFQHPLAFNVIPHIDAFQENGYTKEEMKVTWETRKILDLPDLPVSCTAVRIPTLRAHSEAITIETERNVTPEKARAVLKEFSGVKLVDDPSSFSYPMPINATSAYDVEVGRIRTSLVFGEKGLDFFVCGDQLLRGAALNAVLIAESVKQQIN